MLITFPYVYLPFGYSILMCPCYGLDSSIEHSIPDVTICGHRAFMDVKLNEVVSVGPS